MKAKYQRSFLSLNLFSLSLCDYVCVGVCRRWFAQMSIQLELGLVYQQVQQKAVFSRFSKIKSGLSLSPVHLFTPFYIAFSSSSLLSLTLDVVGNVKMNTSAHG